jgi:hypothetical protein
MKATQQQMKATQQRQNSDSPITHSKKPLDYTGVYQHWREMYLRTDVKIKNIILNMNISSMDKSEKTKKKWGGKYS